MITIIYFYYSVKKSDLTNYYRKFPILIHSYKLISTLKNNWLSFFQYLAIFFFRIIR